MPAKTDVYVALLRGVNVGGKNKLPMKDLVAIFVEAGAGNVRSFIQSGNVVFTAAAKVAAQVPTLVAAGIEQRFGLHTPVVLRNVAEMGKVLAGNPFLKEAVPEDFLHVMFLADLPDPGKVAGLDPNRSPGDTFQVIGRDVYLKLPNGGGHSKLTNAYFDGRLGTVSTIRNWRTVTKLHGMMQEGVGH